MKDEDSYFEWEAKQAKLAFGRIETRKSSYIRYCEDCGTTIDKTEPYRYQVWRFNFEPRGHINQRIDCEFCARKDDKY